MDSGTTLKLDKPNSFDGTISFNTDVSSGGTVTIDLPNSSVTSIGYQGDDLTLYHNSRQLATLAFPGSSSASQFTFGSLSTGGSYVTYTHS